MTPEPVLGNRWLLGPDAVNALTPAPVFVKIWVPVFGLETLKAETPEPVSTKVTTSAPEPTKAEIPEPVLV